MPLDTLALFIPACFALNMAFGPNNLLSLTTGASRGAGLAIGAATGRLISFAVMILITAFGLGALLMASELAFSLVKWGGAAYLVWIGLKLVLTRDGAAATRLAAGGPRNFSGLFRQELLVAAGNPKAILIFTAFFPQFIQPGAYWQSFAVLGVLFLLMEMVAITLYALAGARLKGLMRNARTFTWVNRASGALMMAFGVALALVRRPAS